MTPTPDELVVLLRATIGEMSWAKDPMNSLRAEQLRKVAVRLIEIIDALPEPMRSNTMGVEE